MVEVAQRLMKYSRFATPEAVKMLTESPSLLTELEEKLENGVSMPMFIGPVDISKLGTHSVKLSTTPDKPEKKGMLKRDPPKKKEIEIPSVIPKEKRISPAGNMQNISRSVSDHLLSKRHHRLDLKGASKDGIPLAKEFDGDVKVIKDPSNHMGTQGKIDDFKKLFQSRYRKMKDILIRQYGDLSPCESIINLGGAEDSVRFVGIVNSSRSTKNGHLMLELEDPTGSMRVLVSKNKKELMEIGAVNDEVVGIIGKYKSGDGRGGSIVFADRIYKTDVPGTHRRRVSEDKGLLAVFTSDIHIGSRMYLDKQWDRMIRWLKGEEDGSLKASDGGRVKYFVVAGDLVDGIGIYPDQDKDLIHKDIIRQYDALAESLAMIPDHVEVILMPGNHDAVRIAEPQPPLPEEFQQLFSNSNIHFLSNPSFFSLSGVQVAGYHGKSIDDMVTLYKDVTYEDPIPGLKEMLRSRHYGPTYGMRNQLAPEEEDLLIIENVPDIFVSGHVHRFGLDNYKGVQLVEGGTWQSQTPFQKMMGQIPQPARLGVVELSGDCSMTTWKIPGFA